MRDQPAITDLNQLPETLTIEQFAAWQQISMRAAYYWAAESEGQKGSPFYRVGIRRGQWRVHRDLFLSWRESQNKAA
jgi:hypothetical protein